MSSPKYFQYFPNIQYALSVDKAGKASYINIKDYFHVLKVRDDIYREETLYVPYTILNGERPDEIAYKFYDDEQYYWILLQINEITDYYTQWPLSENELTQFVYKKYGGPAGAAKVHHWETIKTFDDSERPNLVLPGGLKVPENFKFEYPTTPGASVYKTSMPVSVSNYQYERLVNEAKSQIFILDRKYVYQYDSEMRTYARNLEPSISFISLNKEKPAALRASNTPNYGFNV